ncbi:hypothetical protein FRC17_010291 [Serendipita sp. 399]|nr:hypothetical protein FRC17_010291 [Serendipita sp. 399]
MNLKARYVDNRTNAVSLPGGNTLPETPLHIDPPKIKTSGKKDFVLAKEQQARNSKMSDRSTTSSAIEAEIAILKQRLAERLEEEAEERRRVEEEKRKREEEEEEEEEEERRRMEEEEEERRRMEELRWAEEEQEKKEFERAERTMKILERPKAASTSKAKPENGSWPSFDIRRALTAL